MELQLQIRELREENDQLSKSYKEEKQLSGCLREMADRLRQESKKLRLGLIKMLGLYKIEKEWLDYDETHINLMVSDFSVFLFLEVSFDSLFLVAWFRILVKVFDFNHRYTVEKEKFDFSFFSQFFQKIKFFTFFQIISSFF